MANVLIKRIVDVPANQTKKIRLTSTVHKGNFNYYVYLNFEYFQRCLWCFARLWLLLLPRRSLPAEADRI